MKIWTDQEIEFIRTHYATMGGRWCADQTGIPRRKVNDIGERLGLTSPRNIWTPGKTEYLKTNYGNAPTKDIAAALGLSLEQVRWRVESLGLTRVVWSEAADSFLKENYGKLSPKEIAAILGKTRNAVYSRAQVKGIVRFGKSGSTPEQIVATILNYLGVRYATQVKFANGVANKASGRYYWADFLIYPDVVLEVLGDYWHCNPVVYTQGPISSAQEKTSKRDQRKRLFYRGLGLKLVEVWGSST